MILTKKRGNIIFLIIISFLLTVPHLHAADSFKTSDISNVKYQQEIIIPIDTSLEESKHQPIDIRVFFDSTCWAQNQTVHSVRIGYGEESDLTEIESQIYDLHFIDDTHIDACSLVFLIPEEATGSERYYVLYSDQMTDSPSYPNHFKIKDTHYFYEPISGQVMDFDYYQIIEDDFIVYAICQRGELLGNGMSNTIIKLLPESTEFKTKNAEQIASFYMSYSVNPSGTHTGSQWATEIDKTILVQGNLMIRVQIEGISPNGNIKTNNIYTYYYCPKETKRIHVNVEHDVLNTVDIKGTQEREGSYCSLSTIKARSGTIDDMNLGEILPKIHIFNEEETIRSYDIPTDPSAHPADWLLASTDDEDLGSRAWFCMDDPSTGMVHGLIFDKHQGFLNGSDDGIQIKTSVHQHVKLPGLEADSGDLYALRNAYENGEHSTTLSDDVKVNFNVVYVASQLGGYEQIDRESSIFQSLIVDRPIQRGNQSIIQDPDSEMERYTLTVLVRNAPSFPLGSLLSAATGMNISYLTAELYMDNDLASSGSAQRLQLGDVNIDLEGKTLMEKIRTIGNIFDLRNSTVFKSVRFPDLKPGTYLVKIYKENPFIGNQRKYIGYQIVQVNQDTRTQVSCSKETRMEVMVTDQHEKGVEDVEISLMIDDIILSEGQTDSNGNGQLNVALDRKNTMTFQGIYQGFSVFVKEQSFGILNRWRPQFEMFSIDLYDMDLIITDTLGLAPAIDPNPLVTSDEMIISKNIQPSQQDTNTFLFTDLLSNKYHLKMSYKSFKIDKPFDLTQDTSLDIIFPAEFQVSFEVLNAFGLPVGEKTGSLKRETLGPSFDVENGKASAQIPPGTYDLSIKDQNELIAAQQVEVKGDKSLTIISNQGSMVHTLFTVLLLLLGIGGSILFLMRRKRRIAFHIILAMIVILSIFQPWWMLQGDVDDVTTKTTTLLFPATIITLTSSSDVIGGELSEVPEDFTMILEVLTGVLIAASVLFIIHILLFHRYRKIPIVINILIIVFLLLSVILFYVAMSEVTKVGIGAFSGSDTLQITLPGESTQIDISSSWGPSSGMILCIIGLIGAVLLLFQKKLMPLLTRILPFLSRDDT